MVPMRIGERQGTAQSTQHDGARGSAEGPRGAGDPAVTPLARGVAVRLTRAATLDRSRSPWWVAPTIIVALVGFANFVWPTPWEPVETEHLGVHRFGSELHEFRRHRLTGASQVRLARDQEWFELPVPFR